MASRSRTFALSLALGTCPALLSGATGAAAQQEAACDALGLVGLLTTVQEISTRVPLAGAQLTATWRHDGDRVVEVTTDSAGRASFCAPAGVPITLRVSYHHVRSRPQTTSLRPGRDGTYNFSMDAPTSFLRGRVTDESTGAPIANAQLSVANTALSVLTAADGSFQLERIPLGDYVLRVAHLGFAAIAVPLQVRADDLNAAIRLAPYAIPLQPLAVTAFSRRLDLVGFYERERRGLGTFIGRTQIDAMNAQSSADLLRHVPSINQIPRWPQRNAPRMDVSGRGRCRFSYIVDGARTLADFDIDLVAPYAIEGIEVYRGMAEVPAEFRPHVSRDATGSTCGIIAIWTRDSR